jgi:holo-[acyl-carrier protein] synthase
LQRVFSEEELQLVRGAAKQRRSEILAGRFAVKEAVAKAFGTGFSNGLSFRDISTLRGELGEPVIHLHGSARELANSLHVSAIRVSLSHAGGLAVAYVLLECAQAE